MNHTKNNFWVFYTLHAINKDKFTEPYLLMVICTQARVSQLASISVFEYDLFPLFSDVSQIFSFVGTFCISR